MNDLILENMQFARNIAKKKRTNKVNFDEIESAAYFGLVQSARNYNSDKNDCFQAFAYKRISGAINDYFRELNWGGRHKSLNRKTLCENCY